MGAYKEENIDSDFRIASKDINSPLIYQITANAKTTLLTVPDNKSRDMAISHLLQACEMIVNAYLIQHNLEG